ncbi:MAG: hypothetical protein ACJ763_15815 [Bdellovibrionia bacterium]
MRTLTALILTSMSMITTAQAAGYCAPACPIYEGKVDYVCIAGFLERYNSGMFEDRSVEQINKLLYTCKYSQHEFVMQVAAGCAAAR